MGSTGGQILAQSLRVQGVDRVFCVPGESYLAVLDALHDHREAIALTVCRQEGGAAIMAEAYGKLNGRPGVCFATRGPGATNASTGVHTAYQDSTPMVLFIGQVGRDIRDREGFQEVDFKTMFSPLAKWVGEIDDPRRVPEYVHRAFQTAMAGRPGPVVLSLPEDMLSEIVDEEIDAGVIARPVPAAPTEQGIDALVATLGSAKRPLAIVGGGGWSQEARVALSRFAERNNIPVAVSLRCQDYLDNDHSHFVGHFGIGAEPSLIERLRLADCVFALGPRLGEMTTAGYTVLTPPRIGKPLVHVHADPEELGRVYQADLAINASPSAVAQQLSEMEVGNVATRAQWCKDARSDYLESLEPMPAETKLDLGKVIRSLSRALPRDAIICSGAGNYTGWLHRHWTFSHYRTQLAPTSGAMGYGVPAAIAASLLHPDRSVVAVAGDGCFQMHCQELATATQYRARVLFIVVNNAMYGTIRMHQERNYPGRVIGTNIVNPDFVTFARAYGIHAERVEEDEQFAPALERALAQQGSALIELCTDPEIITARTTLSRLRMQSIEQKRQA